MKVNEIVTILWIWRDCIDGSDLYSLIFLKNFADIKLLTWFFFNFILELNEENQEEIRANDQKERPDTQKRQS